MNLITFYLITFLSGVNALICEITWHKYLATLIGAQAKATVVILSIFLGGMSLGYFFFGKVSRKIKNCIRIYAFIEIALCAWCLFFPTLFQWTNEWMPKLFHYTGVSNFFLDLTLSTLLIGFPTFLMGGTLPLLTQGLGNDLKQISQVHARLYGFNTVGAFIGALFCGFFFIPNFGLIGTSYFSSILYLSLGTLSYILAKNQNSTQTHSTSIKNEKLKLNESILLLISFLSGFIIISIQTILVRLAGLSAGSSQYSFSIIVSIFVLCLGLGSLIVSQKKNINFSFLMWNAITTSFLLVALYITCDYWSYSIYLIRISLRDTIQNFYIYQIFVSLFYALILILPIGFSGMLLPICFHLIKDNKSDLGYKVGLLYSSNTIGCVLGSIVGGYFLLYWINLDQVFRVCVFLSLVVSALTIRLNKDNLYKNISENIFLVSTFAFTLFCTFYVSDWDKRRFLQPFRQIYPSATSYWGAESFSQNLAGNTVISKWIDDPNTSLGLGISYDGKNELSRTIFVNGKSDGNTRGDYFTTSLLAHLPLLLNTKNETACVIGFGTGVTLGLLNSYDSVKKIDLAEISSSLLNNRSFFDTYDENASTSAKITHYNTDAFRVLRASEKKYDLIVSEPSNPWVNGIENLYSKEFYQLVNSKLNDTGMLIQWIHTYSFNEDLLLMVLKTMNYSFKQIRIFQLKGGDLALLASKQAITQPHLKMAKERWENSPQLKANLEKAGIHNLETLLALEISTPNLTYKIAQNGQYHTLLSPKLSNNAAKAFFIGDQVKLENVVKKDRQYFEELTHALLNEYNLSENIFSLETLKQMKQSFCENQVSKNKYYCDLTESATELVKVKEKITLNEWHRPTRNLSSIKNNSKVFLEPDLEVVIERYNLMQKYGSNLFFPKINILLDPIEYCLDKTETKNSLYGLCLIQKIIVLNSFNPSHTDLPSTVNKYKKWFQDIQPNFKHYEKLKKAYQELAKLKT